MCLIAFAWQVHPRYPLVLVANRDEFYDRAAAPAHWWPESPGLLAGRDMAAGGTWLAAGNTGRWAAVTNYREGPRQPGKRSRGELPVAFVSSQEAPAVFAAGLASGPGSEPGRAGADYGGFNLLAGDGDSLVWMSNRKPGYQVLDAGIHTLSNHLLNTPWPKAELARLKLQKLLHEEDFLAQDLMSVLADRAPFDDHSLPITGVGLEMERVLSPPFIATEGYGTRCTTVLMVDQQGQMLFTEQTFEDGHKAGSPRQFQLPRNRPEP